MITRSTRSLIVAVCLVALMTLPAGLVFAQTQIRPGFNLGSAAGGAIGTGIAAKNRGQEVTLPKAMTINIQLDSPFEV